ncbi:MAG: ribonuclease HII [Halobacteriaceae archaeon]
MADGDRPDQQGDRVIGVDEAGKGPVVGSMFVAAVAATPAALPAGVADSKQLPADRRQAVAEQLRGAAGVAVNVVEVPVKRIDDPGTDMNGLTVEGHAAALTPLDAGETPVVLDAADTDPDRFARRVADECGRQVDVRAAHGADESHPVVGAASVLAKVARDAHVAALAEQYDRDVGSGYPSDPTTRAFLRDFLADEGRLPDAARRSWQTCRDLLSGREQSDLDEF